MLKKCITASEKAKVYVMALEKGFVFNSEYKCDYTCKKQAGNNNYFYAERSVFIGSLACVLVLTYGWLFII